MCCGFIAGFWVVSLQGEQGYRYSFQDKVAVCFNDFPDCLVSCSHSDVTVELPLMLMHPKPEGNVWNC